MAEGAEQVVLSATGRAALGDGLAWIREGRRRRSEVAAHDLLCALLELESADTEDALRVLTQEVVRSEVDSSVDLFGLDAVIPPRTYRDGLVAIRSATSNDSLTGVTVEALAYAQQRSNGAVLALALVAGLSYRDLRDRVASSGGSLPSDWTGPWQLGQVSDAFTVINEIVSGTQQARLPSARPARPVEMVLDGEPQGWQAVEDMFSTGVPYEVLLTQRAVGGAWLAHRQATTGLLASAVADELAAALTQAGVDYRRASAFGGDQSRSDLATHVGSAAGQVAVVIMSNGAPCMAIAVSTARDGGTARKNAGRLRSLPGQLTMPAAAMLAGPGWSQRSETVELVKEFQGRVFTDVSVSELVAAAAAVASEKGAHKCPME